jgi:glutathione reductase (NADPH)
MMATSFDLVVIGTGGGGSVTAHRCRSAGWRVAIVDELPYGGTCALRGCDPKKVLVGAADLVDWSGRMQGRGAHGRTEIDWPELMSFKRSFTDPITPARLAAFEKVGMATYQGRARFENPERLVVGGETLESRYFLIAAGARPRPLRIDGEAHLVSSTDFLALPRLPERIAFVGGGYISFEFAHVAQRAGARAVILGRGTPLRHFDQDLVQRLVHHTREIGVDARFDAEVTAVEKRGSRYLVRIDGDGGRETVEVDLVVHGAGRIPNTEGLGLETGHVAADGDGGVQVNEFLQSPTNSRVYAAGDAAAQGNLPLTPVAGYQSGIVASNLLDGNSRTADYRGIPSVAFTIPPLAGVGLTEAEARRRQLDVRVKSQDTSGWYSSRRVHETAAMFKTVVDDGSDQILGAHLLGPHAEEVINLFALAIRQNLTASDLKHQLYAYPTSGSDVPYMV